MPFTDEGYEKTAPTEIIREKEIQFEDLFDVVNNSVSDILWQWMKNGIYERQEIEDLIEIGTEQMSITDAVGIFLDKHGLECGIERKGATRAQGYVEVSRSVGASAFSIPKGTEFASATNIYASEDSTDIPYFVINTKRFTGNSIDFFEAKIIEVDGIDRITNMNNEIIDPVYYELDPTYKNSIHWFSGSSAVLIENERYIVYFSGPVKIRIEVTSQSSGAEANASINSVTSCIQFPDLTVTNRREITGGRTRETDSSYRRRLLSARRRTFTLGNIRDIILGVEGVRSCKVWQDTGVDQHSVEDWNSPIGTGEIIITGMLPIYSQAFVPGDHILTLGKITLRGDTNNSPPALICGIKRDVDYWGTGERSPYFDYDIIDRWDLDQTVSGFRDVEFTLNYNGLDKTKTYRFDIFCDDPGVEDFDWNIHYWKLLTTTEGYGTGPRKELYQMSGTSGFTGTWVGMGDGIDLMFKTHFKGAGYTSLIATHDGWGYENVRSEILDLLDYVEGDNPGFSPICIQPQIAEASKVHVDMRVVIYITELAEFSLTRKEIEERVEAYLEGLDTGENVIYSRIWHIIMDNPQVVKLDNLYIKRNDEVEYVQRDLGITDYEISDLGVRSIQLGGRL